jgi:hypothetical protein
MVDKEFLKQALDDLGAAGRLVRDQGQVFVLGVLFLAFLEHEMGVDEDGCQWIVDFVGDARSQLSQGRQFLRPDQLFLGFLQIAVGFVQLGVEPGILNGDGRLSSEEGQGLAVVFREGRPRLFAGDADDTDQPGAIRTLRVWPYEEFAARRMDRSIRAALAGRVDLVNPGDDLLGRIDLALGFLEWPHQESRWQSLP